MVVCQQNFASAGKKKKLNLLLIVFLFASLSVCVFASRGKM